MRKAFINGNLIDIINKEILERHSIILEDGKIAKIGKDLDTTGMEVIDLDGKYVSPGLFNAHVHIAFDSHMTDLSNLDKSPVNLTLLSLENLEKFIRNGIIFVRDLGAPDKIILQIRDAVIDGKVKMSPDIQAAGNAICMTGGTGWYMIGYEADGVEENRKAARQMIKDGADVIKMMATGGVLTKGSDPEATQLSEEEMRAAVVEAHKFGKQVCVHSHNNAGVLNAVRAGVDVIEHGSSMDDETIDLMLEKGTWLCGTISASYNIANGLKDGSMPEFYEKAVEVRDKRFETFGRAYRAGIPCAHGSDAGSSFCHHDESTREMILMVEKAGLTPFEALEVATMNSAKLLGVEDELGSISVGKRGSFAIYNDNPIEDIRVTENCVMTVKDGEILWNGEM